MKESLPREQVAWSRNKEVISDSPLTLNLTPQDFSALFDAVRFRQQSFRDKWTDTPLTYTELLFNSSLGKIHRQLTEHACMGTQSP